MALYFHRVSSPVGTLTLYADEQTLRRMDFGLTEIPDTQEAETYLLHRAACQLDEYFRGERRAFTIPLMPQGTDFQKQVWQVLCAIPWGQTCSYAQIAAAVGSVRACRAVGQANHANPLPVFIPCHRVVRADGDLGGYRGGLDRKAFLLYLEGRR